MTGYHFPFNGRTFSVEAVNTMALFLQKLSAALSDRLWKKTSLHRNGKGLDEGTEVAAITGYHDYLRKKNRHK